MFWVGDPTANDSELLADHPQCKNGLAATLGVVGKIESGITGVKYYDWQWNTSAMNGYRITKWLKNNKSGQEGPHKYTTSYTPSAPANTSGWYLPSFVEAKHVFAELDGQHGFDKYHQHWVSTAHENTWRLGHIRIGTNYSEEDYNDIIVTSMF